MALHNIKIVVVDGGRNNYRSNATNMEVNNPSPTNENKSSPLYKLLNMKQTIKSKVQSGMSPSAVYAMNMGLKIGEQIVSQAANYYLSDIGRKNGDNSLQEHIGREIEIVSDATSLIGGSLSGAATGSMFGAVGAVIGTIAGLAGSAISIGFRQAERERSFNFKEFSENNSIEYQRARASISLTTGRLR